MIDDSGTVGSGSAEAIGAFAGEMLGDFPADAPEFAEAPAEGTPSPSESPDTPSETPTPAEGETPVEPASTPSPDAPVEVSPDEPAPVDPETGFDTDPALTYTVNGVERAYDGIRLVDGAGYIKPSALADVQRKLGERDHLFDANQTLYRTTQEYQRLGGAQAFETLKSESEANSAAGMVLMKAIADAFPGPEHAQALKDLFARAEFEMRKTAFDASQKFRSEFQVQATQQGIPTYPERFENSFAQLRGWAKANNHTFTDADEKEAREIFADTLMRTATAEEQRQHGSAQIFDPSALNRWVERKVAANAAAAKTATVVKQATTANQNRLATAGKPKPAAPVVRKPVANVDQRAQDASDAWDLKERLASARLAGTR